MTECIKEGAALTSVHSKEEDDFLNELGDGNNYWLGGYPNDYTWFWVDYTDFDYTHEYDVDPGYARCLYQSGSYYGSGWSNTYCTDNSKLSYICKKI